MGRIFLNSGKPNPIYQAFNPADTVGQTSAPTPTTPTSKTQSSPSSGGLLNRIFQGVGGTISQSPNQALSAGLAGGFPITQIPGMFPEMTKLVQQTGQGIGQNIQDLRSGNIADIQKRNQEAGISLESILSQPIQPAIAALSLPGQGGKAAKEAGKSTVEQIVLGKVLSKAADLFQGLGGGASRAIAQIVKDKPVEQKSLDDIFNRIQYEAPSGVKPQDFSTAFQDVKDAIQQTKVKIANGEPPLKVLQDWKNSLNYTDSAKAYGAKLDKALGKILSEEIKFIAPEIKTPYAQFATGAKVKGFAQRLGSRIPYLAERAIVNAPLYFLLRQATKQAEQTLNP